MPVIPAIWEVEIGRITVQGQPRQKVSETPLISINKLSILNLYQAALKIEPIQQGLWTPRGQRSSLETPPWLMNLLPRSWQQTYTALFPFVAFYPHPVLPLMCVCNEQIEKECRKIIPFTMASKE
jgi:hypothetical protein